MVREFTFNEVYYLLLAARWTVLLALIAFAGGGLLGMVIAAMRVSPSRALRWAAQGYIQFFQGAAFFGEIFYGSIQSVPGGQWEASRSLGFRFLATLRLVILPQAFKLMIPPTIGFMVQIVKGTSVASLIGLTELARTATVINTITFEPALVFGIVAAIYFALCWPLSLLGAAMERRLRVDAHRAPLERIGPDVATLAVAAEEGR
jgi:polar amino acid transport system permease protein